MIQPNSEDIENVPQPSAPFGNVRNDSETFGTVPHGSETFGKIPKDSESFGTLRNDSERQENHTLTVRDAARLFEAAGVARTERSIINWCQPNRMGIARLDSYFDPNERRYFITQQSVELAIAEEKAKAAKLGQEVSEPTEPVPNASESRSETPPAPPTSAADAERLKQIEQELLDMKILNGGKDFVIKQLRDERNGFIQQVIEGSRQIGALETRLLQLEGPSSGRLSTEASSEL